MPKHPGPRRRENSFFIGGAVPKDLQGRGPYVNRTGKLQSEILRTLGTSSPKVAQKRVHEEWIKLDREFEQERFKLAKPHLGSREFAAKAGDLERGKLKKVSLDDLDARTEAFQ